MEVSIVDAEEMQYPKITSEGTTGNNDEGGTGGGGREDILTKIALHQKVRATFGFLVMRSLSICKTTRHQEGARPMFILCK